MSTETVRRVVSPTWRHRRGALPYGERALVMGILNVTPDSFSDGGHFLDADRAVQRVAAMLRDQVDIVDVGGESTRPGAAAVSPGEECARVLPVIERVRATSDVVISIDTTKAEVAASALAAGADIVNDISGGVFEPAILDVAAASGAGLVLTHTPARPDVMNAHATYDDVVAEVCEALRGRIEAALRAGVALDAIAVDPGFGFGKTADQNYALLAALDRVAEVHPCVLAGVSRKRMIRHAVGESPAAVEHGTTAANALAAMCGAAVIRAHDVAAARACLDVVACWRSAQGARA